MILTAFGLSEPRWTDLLTPWVRCQNPGCDGLLLPFGCKTALVAVGQSFIYLPPLYPAESSRGRMPSDRNKSLTLNNDCAENSTITLLHRLSRNLLNGRCRFGSEAATKVERLFKISATVSAVSHTFNRVQRSPFFIWRL